METFYARPQMRQVLEARRSKYLDNAFGPLRPVEQAKIDEIMALTLPMSLFEQFVDTFRALQDRPSQSEEQEIESAIRCERANDLCNRLAGVSFGQALKPYDVTDEDREAFARAQRFQRLRFLVTL